MGIDNLFLPASLILDFIIGLTLSIITGLIPSIIAGKLFL